ncbi:YncE family protein [Dinghuibacter silviterrae]|uniref:YVTN family beta-propeller protein n=1 Tax=Dinghuibacter silviterrae TaxID=1539049 RepID=A0A4R8DHQ3_9BACT|nr:YncE family protein [Dinghuibacter silviterrae]TDW96784.1 YVTN family beta-propeller protein [Dinghuibacter silviterrae]
MKKLILFLSMSGIVLPADYAVLNTFHIASSGGWDYIFVDPQSNHLYVSHGTQVNILDKATGDSLGVIPNTTGVHGIAIAPNGKGYTSNGRINTVTVFDQKSLAVEAQIPAGQNPDAIFYDDYSGKVVTCNGRSQDLSIIDPATNQVVATVPVGGKPETAVSDGAGKIFVNIEDKAQIIAVDAKTFQVVNRWSIAPGESPSGLAIDRKTRRLFAGCDNKTLIVLDADKGTVVAQVPIGDGCDGVGFDSKLRRVYSSNGEGTLTVIQEKDASTFTVLANVPTKRGARTCTVDESTHKIYTPTADFEATTAPGQRRPNTVPGSFQVLVVGLK